MPTVADEAFSAFRALAYRKRLCPVGQETGVGGSTSILAIDPHVETLFAITPPDNKLGPFETTRELGTNVGRRILGYLLRKVFIVELYMNQAIYFFFTLAVH